MQLDICICSLFLMEWNRRLCRFFCVLLPCMFCKIHLFFHSKHNLDLCYINELINELASLWSSKNSPATLLIFFSQCLSENLEHLVAKYGYFYMRSDLYRRLCPFVRMFCLQEELLLKYRVFIKYCVCFFFFKNFLLLGCYWLYKKRSDNQSDYSLISLEQLSRPPTCRGWVALNWEKNTIFNEHQVSFDNSRWSQKVRARKLELKSQSQRSNAIKGKRRRWV